MSGKLTIATVPPRNPRATGGNGQRLESFFIPQSAFRIGFEQSQIIGRIHLNHLGVNQTRAREQTNLRRILDHMIIGNQITNMRSCDNFVAELLFDNLRSFWLKAALAISRFSGLTQKLFYEYIRLALNAETLCGAKEKNMNGESASFRLYSFLNCPFEKFRD